MISQSIDKTAARPGQEVPYQDRGHGTAMDCECPDLFYLGDTTAKLAISRLLSSYLIRAGEFIVQN